MLQTIIKSNQLNNGGNFPTILKNHQKWLNEITNGDVIILTCVFLGFGAIMIKECKKWALK